MKNKCVLLQSDDLSEEQLQGIYLPKLALLLYASSFNVCTFQVLRRIGVQGNLATVSHIIGYLGTVNAVTLIFMSGRGSAISSAKEVKPGSIYNLMKS